MSTATPAPAPRPTMARALPPGLGPAAERFARNTLRKSAQTQRTYRSTYERFAAWLAQREATAQAPIAAFTADALASYLDAREAAGAAPATVKKERAALNRLARYLHQLGAIDATEILMVETGVEREAEARHRDALDEHMWQRVKAATRQRLVPSPRARTSLPAAARDLAMILLLGDMGLRNEEVRTVERTAVKQRRADGTTPWLHISGKGRKKRHLPIGLEAEVALDAWCELRDALFDHTEALLFPRLGRRRADGTFPDAGGQLSSRALRDVVRPLMLAAGVAPELAHPHVLRHTYGTLYMRRRRARLEDLRLLMGHASIETTTVYVHKTAQDVETAVLDNQAHTDDALRASATRRMRRRRRLAA